MSRLFQVVVNLGIASLFIAAAGAVEAPSPSDRHAPKPLYRDPVYDGAADPALVWRRGEQKWLMFYTNRRANVSLKETPGVTWVHGTRIGVAESSDCGLTWKYRGTAQIDYGGDEATYWAPAVLYHDGVFHMFLTYVPGIFRDWNHPREMLHLTSGDAITWNFQSKLQLASDRCIDACVIQLPEGGWRLWYNNERDRKSIYYADSPNLADWIDRGKVDGVGERPGEGPIVFTWKDHTWMIVDLWKGLGVYRSDDALHWTAGPFNLLDRPGTGADDAANGQHADVIVSNGRAYLFYFTHPDRKAARSMNDSYEQRRSSIQVVELELGNDGWLHCDRDLSTDIQLAPQ